ncbi:MAG: SDR family oxidoreductase [Anaerolineae bacterium]|nr:SDR family oxidoreductase [Anaerolineae bacterium]MBT4309517.1 SDR family oxidoreductase [Anaerolineae bacterium]MBT4457293.1 SDR family oxidoreductase [Anaerolineae bacterium]MBT4843000.1 SDR family oxidoreductase [Anaerolineae bacterium]MBT6060527.1 SDR family oxidoreductase [Anaerolineae bacterium]
MKKVVLVTGANRGIGLETAKQMKAKGYEVILTSRDAKKGEVAARDLGVHFHPFDVLSEKSIAALKSYVETEFGRLDALINNAGILLDRNDHILDIPEEKLRKTLDTNTYAPLALTRAFLPMMLDQNYGRIVNVSSVLGQIISFNDYTPAYRLSKLALNGITLMLADAVKGKNILINSVHPGWVKTDMGGAEAPLGLEEGARGLVWAATLPDNGPQGGFFQDGKRMEW